MNIKADKIDFLDPANYVPNIQKQMLEEIDSKAPCWHCINCKKRIFKRKRDFEYKCKKGKFKEMKLFVVDNGFEDMGLPEPNTLATGIDPFQGAMFSMKAIMRYGYECHNYKLYEVSEETNPECNGSCIFFSCQLNKCKLHEYKRKKGILCKIGKILLKIRREIQNGKNKMR